MRRRLRKSIASAAPLRPAVRGPGVQAASLGPRAKSRCASKPNPCAPRRGSRQPSSTGCSAGSARATSCLGRWRCCLRPPPVTAISTRRAKTSPRPKAALKAVRSPPPAPSVADAERARAGTRDQGAQSAHGGSGGRDCATEGSAGRFRADRLERRPEEQQARAQGTRRFRRGTDRTPGGDHQQAQGRAGRSQRAPRPASRALHGRNAPDRRWHRSGLGTGAPARDMERRKLVERVAQVRPALATEKPKPPSALAGTVEATNGAERTAGNGHVAKLDTGAAPEKAATVAPVVAPPAAEMPQTAAIPEARRKPRLLDRITSLAKS